METRSIIKEEALKEINFDTDVLCNYSANT